ncbi:MAG: PIN domain-containing protein [Pseudolysinimonas sp.]
MILVDTSVWIDHLHRADPELVALLERNDVATHAMVIGELALGTIAKRDEFLGLLAALPAASEASHAEVVDFVSARRLYGRGLSLVDAHLLASAVLGESTLLWTRDRRLASAAADLGHAWHP